MDETPIKQKKRLNTAGTAVSTNSAITSEGTGTPATDAEGTGTPATEAESPIEMQIEEEPQLTKLMTKVKECLQRFY